MEDRLEYTSVMQASARVCYPRVTQHGKIDEQLHLIIWAAEWLLLAGSNTSTAHISFSEIDYGKSWTVCSPEIRRLYF